MAEILNNLVEGFDPTKVNQSGISEDWQKIYTAVQNRLILQAEITGLDSKLVPGEEKEEPIGIIQIGEVRGILPLRLSGEKTKEGLRKLLGRTVAFHIATFDRQNDVFVADRKSAIEQMAEMTWEKAEIGQQRHAVIREVHPVYVLVDIGGVITKIQREEMSYAWIDSLTEKYHVGDHIPVAIIKLDKEEKRIKLSHKVTQKNPYPDCLLRFKEQGEYSGKVTGVVEYGIFVNVEPGVDILCKNVRSFAARLHKADKVIVRIKKIDNEKQQMYGEIKQRL